MRKPKCQACPSPHCDLNLSVILSWRPSLTPLPLMESFIICSQRPAFLPFLALSQLVIINLTPWWLKIYPQHWTLSPMTCLFFAFHSVPSPISVAVTWKNEWQCERSCREPRWVSLERKQGGSSCHLGAHCCWGPKCNCHGHQLVLLSSRSASAGPG